MSKPIVLSATLLASLALLPAAQAVSPVDRMLGSSDYFDPSPYSEQDLDEEKQFAPQTEGDADLGEQFVLKRYSNRAPIRFKLETGAFWSDNIASASFAEADGWFWATRADVSWRPRLGPNLFLDTYIQEDIYRYDKRGLDFESTEFGLGLVKIFPDLGELVVFGRYEFEHINADSFFGPDTSNHYHRLHVGAHKNFLNQPKHTAYAAVDAGFDLDADPNFTERYEYAAHLGYSWHPTDQITTTAFYRAAWIDYQNSSREDVFQTAGLELAYTFNEALELKTSLIYGNNDSDSPFGANDYEAFQAGLIASLVVKW